MKLGVPTASDASFTGEIQLKSQQGEIHVLCPAEELLDPENCPFDVLLVWFRCTTIKRVCRATLQAEIYVLQNAQEAGDKIHAVLAEMYGPLVPGPDSYDSATSRHAMRLPKFSGPS